MIKAITYTEPDWQVAYPPDYLEGVLSVTRLVFIQMNEINEYNIFDQIDAYMRTSDSRKKMDEGNWQALCKGWKQLYNSADLSGCRTDNVKSDDIMLHWIADITVYWQWRYGLSSKEMSLVCPAELLSQLYYPLHETSIQNACEKLQRRFFAKESI